MNAKRGIIVLGLLSAASSPMWAQQIKGVVIDQKSKETLIGAVITVDGTNVKAITNIDGNFQIDGLKKDKTYTLYINYVGYKTQKIDGVQAKDADQVIALITPAVSSSSTPRRFRQKTVSISPWAETGTHPLPFRIFLTQKVPEPISSASIMA